MHLNPSTNLLSILISSEPECTCHLLSSPRAGNNIVYHPSQCHSFSLPFLYFFLYIILFSNHYEVLFFRSITFLYYYTYTFPFFFLLLCSFFFLLLFSSFFLAPSRNPQFQSIHSQFNQEDQEKFPFCAIGNLLPCNNNSMINPSKEIIL